MDIELGYRKTYSSELFYPAPIMFERQLYLLQYASVGKALLLSSSTAKSTIKLTVTEYIPQ